MTKKLSSTSIHPILPAMSSRSRPPHPLENQKPKIETYHALDAPTSSHYRGTFPRRNRADSFRRRRLQENPPAQREKSPGAPRQDHRQPLPRAQHPHPPR